MTVGHQDHGRIAMAVAAMLSGAVHQPLDLALGEVTPLDCQVYDAWGAFLGCGFHADKPCLRAYYCIYYRPLLNTGTLAATSTARVMPSTQTPSGRCTPPFAGAVARQSTK